MSTDKEPFLSRWSRRKLDSAKGPAAPRSVAPVAPPAVGPDAAQSPAKTELPPVDTLKGLASEYKDFLRPGVDEKLRQSALKKLFHDPHFNVMDGLDTYIDDYSKPDPIPEEMLKTLKQANRLLFPEEAAERDRQIEAETQRALEQIRTEVAELTLIATTKVTGKVLEDADHKRLIDEAIRDLDFSVLEKEA